MSGLPTLDRPVDTPHYGDDQVRDLLEATRGDVPCGLGYNQLRCDQPARWRVFWQPLPCGHWPKPGHVCEPHRDMLTGSPVWLSCPRCTLRWPTFGHLDRVEAL